jgi:hypothetical protein
LLQLEKEMKKKEEKVGVSMHHIISHHAPSVHQTPPPRAMELVFLLVLLLVATSILPATLTTFFLHAAPYHLQGRAGDLM